MRLQIGKARFALCVLTAVGLVWGCAARAEVRQPRAGAFKPQFQKGMCYTTWTKERFADPASDESLKSMASTGTGWVSIIANWYQEKPYTTTIFPTEKTPSDASIVHAIRTAHGLGMKVMLKPLLDLMKEAGSWRGEISCPTDIETEAWFKSYADFMLHYAKLAQENDVELLCIGTELTCLATTQERMWRDKIIGPVRKVYKGPLTYASNWNDEFPRVKFWDALDYVGIDAYFPLSDKDVPNLDELKQGWDAWVKEIEDFQKKVAKPVIFPEVGYCSVNGAAKKPWEEATSGKVNMALQADCYEALFQTFWNKPWFYGAYWWKWGTDVRFGGPSNKGYSPQNKTALETLKKRYKASAPRRDPSIFTKTVK